MLDSSFPFKFMSQEKPNARSPFPRRSLTFLSLFSVLTFFFFVTLPQVALAETVSQDNPSNTESQSSEKSPQKAKASQTSKSTAEKSSNSKANKATTKKSSNSKANNSKANKATTKKSSNSKANKATTKKSSNSKANKATTKKSSNSKANNSKANKATTKKSIKAKSTKAKSTNSKASFSKAEIERVKNLPYETWESPHTTSELGLPIEPGYVQPYPYGNLMRLYNGNRCRHRGLDIGTVGSENGGMGTVINSATPGVITFIGRTGQDTFNFGKADTRAGTTRRTGKTYPRQILVPGYGLVYPFSRNYGKWRSGTIIAIRITQGPLKDHIVRYMHLAAVRPDLHVGDSVQAGEHIALMGGTAILESWPHVHIDLETPDRKRTDLAPYIGLPHTGAECKKLPNPPKKSASKSSRSSQKSASKSSRSSKKSAKSTVRPRKSYTKPAPESPDKPAMRTLER